MVRRAMTDPVAWLLVLVAVVVSAVAIANIGAVTAAEGCANGRLVLAQLCYSGPDRMHVLIEVLLALAAWCLVGMRVARPAARGSR